MSHNLCYGLVVGVSRSSQEHDLGVRKIGAIFGSPYSKDHSILGSILRTLIFANSNVSAYMAVSMNWLFLLWVSLH